MISYQRFYLFLLIALLILPQWSASQTKTYTGSLRIGQYVGNANFQYNTLRQDTILNGSFQIKGSNVDSILNSRINYFNFSGNYQENTPDGTWKIQLGDFSSNGEASLDHYKLKLKVDGLLQEAVIKIDQGVLLDKQYWVCDIEQSVISNIPFSSRMTSQKDSIKGEFSIVNDSIDLCGYVADNGLADGEWLALSMASGNTIYRLQFEDGWLKSLRQQQQDRTVLEADLFGEDIGASKAIRLSTKYFYVLNLLQSLKKEPLLPFEAISALISQNENFERLTDSLLLKLGVVEDQSNVKVLLPHHPLDEREKSHLASIAQKLHQADSTFNSIQSNANLSILKQKDKAVLFYADEAKRIKKQFIDPYQKLIDLHEEEVIAFLPRSSLGHLFLDNTTALELEAFLSDCGKWFEIDELNRPDQNRQGLDGINNKVGLVVACLDSLDRRIDEALKDYELDQEAVAKETELMQRQQAFVALADTAIIETPSPYSALIVNVKASVQKEIDEYWEINNSVVKILRVEELQECIGKMEKLVRLITSLPERHKAIEEAYTVETWNTFTATTMTEITKKRIYNAYFNDLLPSYISKINFELSCESVVEIINLFNKTHLRMFELRKEDTSDIETTLKKKPEAREVMTIFKITTA